MLINDAKTGEDNGKISWYPEPHYSFIRIFKESSKEITGTFRSAQCLHCADSGTFKNDMCSACEGVPKLPSFKKRVLLRSEKAGPDGKRDNTTIRNDFLSPAEMKEKLKVQKEKLDDKDSKPFFLKSKNLRLRMRKRTLDEKLAEFARCGSMKAICHNLEKAADNGYLKEKKKTRWLVCCRQSQETSTWKRMGAVTSLLLSSFWRFCYFGVGHELQHL